MYPDHLWNNSVFKTSKNRSVGDKLLEIHDILRLNLPPEESWPNGEWPVRHGFDPISLEISVGAILTQNTRWERVETALIQMEKSELTSYQAILDCSPETLESVIHTTGFFRQKAATLKRLCQFLVNLKKADYIPERKNLLLIKGIGPETADTILLYVFNQPEMIADAYSRRLLSRLGIVPPDSSYNSIKRDIESRLPSDPKLYRSFHALVIQLCKFFCRPRPKCSECVLVEKCEFR